MAEVIDERERALLRGLLKSVQEVVAVRSELEAAADAATRKLRAELQVAIDAAVLTPTRNVERLARQIVPDPRLTGEALVIEALARVRAASRGGI